MTQLVLPLHECAAMPLQDAVESIVDSAAAEAATDPAGSGAALAEIFCLCVQV
jgi:hypothetical protein